MTREKILDRIELLEDRIWSTLDELKELKEALKEADESEEEGKLSPFMEELKKL